MSREAIIQLCATIFALSATVVVIAAGYWLTRKTAVEATMFPSDYSVIEQARGIMEQAACDAVVPVGFDGGWCSCGSRRCMCGGCQACDTCLCPKLREKA